MWSNAIIKMNGRDTFKANYWPCVLVGFILMLSSGGFASSGSNHNSGEELSNLYNHSHSLTPAFTIGLLVGAAISIVLGVFVFSALQVGCNRFFLINQLQHAKISEVAFAFKSNYLNIIKTMFIVDLKIVIGCIYFFFPGIVLSYKYRMVPYILNENPNMSPKEAQEASARMMDGNKMSAFTYDLSFIGWYILSAFTLGILFALYVTPYKASADAQLYMFIRNQSGVMSNSGNTSGAQAQQSAQSQPYSQSTQSQPYSQTAQSQPYSQNTQAQPYSQATQSQPYSQNTQSSQSDPMEEPAPVYDVVFEVESDNSEE